MLNRPIWVLIAGGSLSLAAAIGSFSAAALSAPDPTLPRRIYTAESGDRSEFLDRWITLDWSDDGTLLTIASTMGILGLLLYLLAAGLKSRN